MEQYIYDRLIEEIAATELFNDAGKQIFQDFAVKFNQPKYEAELNELLAALIEYRMKAEMFDAQAYSIIREHLEPLFITLKEKSDLSSEETVALLKQIDAAQAEYKSILINQR